MTGTGQRPGTPPTWGTNKNPIMETTEKNNAKHHVNGATHLLEKAAMQDQFATREKVREFLQKDVAGIYVLISEIMASKEIIDAITDVIYNRYLKIREEKEKQAAINFPEE